jgi:mono/diheme cytochrome c family protein
MATVPISLLVLAFLIFYGGMVYFDRTSGWFNPQVYAPYRSLAELNLYQPPTGGLDLTRGKAVYENICALCHNTDGTGKPNQAPPFVGSEWVLGSPDRMIRIPLVGLAGPIKVKDQEWNLAMPNMGAALSDDDLAAVLTYMRQSWGNKASAITPEQVKAVRAKVGNRTQPWSAQELNAIP